MFTLASPVPKRPIKLRNLTTDEQSIDNLHNKYKPKTQAHGCTESRCLASNLNPVPVEHKVRDPQEVLEQATEFINNFYASVKRLDSAAHKARLAEVEEQVRSNDTYYLKETELIYGAKQAWRNASRCIGRIQWSKLQVFDARFTTNANEMFEAICNHIKYATNKGKIRSAITILPPRVKSVKNDWRIWNSQLIGYAGYKDPKTGKVVGDPANCDVTEVCIKLGWKGKGTHFDVLPLVLSAAGGPPQYFTLPDDIILRVKIQHPKYKWFAELGLEWYALPAVANMMLDVGGIQFTAAPFSGWYMVTEIGTRDLGDTYRYNKLEEIAQRMGLNTTSNASLWKDIANVELNLAVLDSFQNAGVTIVDHHTACDTFMTHLANEQRLRGGCPADWVWLVPPTSGSLTPVFHQEMVNYHLLPNYEYMEPICKTYDWSAWDRQQAELAEKQLARKSSLATNAALVASGKSPLLGLAASGGCGQQAAVGMVMSPASGRPLTINSNGELTPRKLRFKEIARAVKFTSKLFGKALSRRIKATILYATETGKSERFANKLAQTFSSAFNVHLMSMSDYDMTCLEHEALLLVVTSTFGNGDPPENGELFAKHLAAVKITGDTSPDIDSINSVSSNPFFQMMSEDHSANKALGKLSTGSKHDEDDEDEDDDDSDDTHAPKPRTQASDDMNNEHNNDQGVQLDLERHRKRQLKRLKQQQHEDTQSTHVRPLSNVRFGIFALGSTAYPHYCAFGRYVDQILGDLGAERIYKCTCGDELCGQEKAFNEWSSQVFKVACDVFCLTDSIGPIDERPETVWSPKDVKFVPVELVHNHQDISSVSYLDKFKLTNTNSLDTIDMNTRNNPHQTGSVDGLRQNLAMSRLKSMSTSLVSPSQTTQQQQQHQTSLMNKQTTKELLISQSTTMRNLASITNKRIISFTLKNRTDLHQYQPEENLQTICLDLESENILSRPSNSGLSRSPTQQLSQQNSLVGITKPLVGAGGGAAGPISFEPGDHIAIYPVNTSCMVEQIIERMRRDLGLVEPGEPPQQAVVSSPEVVKSSSESPVAKFDFDQVYTILVKRENMDLTPAPTATIATPTCGTDSASGSSSGQQDSNWIPHDRLPMTSMREALTRYLDITSAPNQEFLSILARQTSDLDERKRLQQLAKYFTLYEDWKNKQSPNLLTVLKEFATIKFEPAIVTQIPLLKPRFYSVSGTQVSLTVGVVRFKTQTGALREGLCSNYLNSLPIGRPSTYIFGYVRSAPAFHMPKDKTIPMILISAGTGLAPFRSFWKQRHADMIDSTTTSINDTRFGCIKLYFGCRNSNYVLYKDELSEMLAQGVLSSVRVAFSRPTSADILPEDSSHDHDMDSSSQATNKGMLDHIKQPNRRIYVQDKLVDDGDDLYRLIMFHGAHIYVCGDVAMADGVYKTLAGIISQCTKASPDVTTSRNLADKLDSLSLSAFDSGLSGSSGESSLRSMEDGEGVLMNLRNLNRYHEDIFGAKQAS